MIEIKSKISKHTGFKNRLRSIDLKKRMEINKMKIQMHFCGQQLGFKDLIINIVVLRILDLSCGHWTRNVFSDDQNVFRQIFRKDIKIQNNHFECFPVIRRDDKNIRIRDLKIPD